MYFILCDSWKALVFVKVYRYPEALLNRHVLVFFETIVLKEVCMLFFISTILIPKLIYANANSKVPK